MNTTVLPPIVFCDMHQIHFRLATPPQKPQPRSMPQTAALRALRSQHYSFPLMICFGNWIQESHVVARKPGDASAVIFGLKFADNVHYKFDTS